MSVRITTLDSADQMTRYYTKRDNLEAYYCENQEFNGYWGGKAARLLGLDKYIADEAFSRLTHNLHPLTGEQLTARMRTDRRPGFDITFDVPKSVSLAYAYSKDDRIVWLVRQIVYDTMAEMEPQAAGRVREGLDKNADGDRPTGNFVYAEYIHLTARPVNGYADPHLHIHVAVMNLTFDPEEKKWKALQMGNIHENVKTYQGAFHRRLKEGLEAMGLETEPSKHLFEIKGIERDLIEKFSRRTKKIEATAKRLGITDPAQKAKLGALTREKKDKSLSIPDLEPFWWGGLTAEHKAALEGVKTRLQRSLARELSRQMVAATPEQSSTRLGTFDEPPVPREIEASSDSLGTRKQPKPGKAKRPPTINQRTGPGMVAEAEHAPTEHDRRAVAMAMKHLLERESAVTEMRLLGEAFNNWQCDQATRAGIIQAVAEAPLLRLEKDGRTWVTTPEILAEERRLTDLCLRGKGKFEPINPHWKITAEPFNEGQRNAVRHALNSRDFVIGISGVAGGGKTTIMREIYQAAKARFWHPLVLAPLAATAHETLRRDGFEQAETIAKFLNSEALQKEARDGLLLVDEAGMISDPLGEEFLQVAHRLGARVIFVGDAGQLHSIQRGQLFKHLQGQGKMEVAEVTEVVRQDGAYKQFVEQYVAGQPRRAMNSLWTMRAVTEQPLEQLKRTLARDYVDAIAKGQSALAVSPTHAEIGCLTDAVRDELKVRKMLGRGVTWGILRNQSWTEAQKGDTEHYKGQRGLIVQFNDHVKGFALGERVEVIDVRDDVVRVRYGPSYDSGIKKLPLHEAKKFGVYEPDKIEICEGDRILIAGNGRDASGRRFNNGNQLKVDHIAHDGKLVLENGLRLEKGFPHILPGWIVTPNAAQGRTVDAVFACQTQELSAPATNRDQVHVATTRGRESLKLYTDNFEWVKDCVTETPERMTATELLEGETVRTPAADARLCELEKIEALRDTNEYNRQIVEAQETKAMEERLGELEAAEASRDIQQYKQQFAEPTAAKPPPLSAMAGQTAKPDMKLEMELERIRREELAEAEQQEMALAMTV